jgi:hypothetical protein
VDGVTLVYVVTANVRAPAQIQAPNSMSWVLNSLPASRLEYIIVRLTARKVGHGCSRAIAVAGRNGRVVL